MNCLVLFIFQSWINVQVIIKSYYILMVSSRRFFGLIKAITNGLICHLDCLKPRQLFNHWCTSIPLCSEEICYVFLWYFSLQHYRPLIISTLRWCSPLFNNISYMLNCPNAALGRKRLNILGHIVSQDGVARDHSKVKAIFHWHVPTSLKHLRPFLRLNWYYRRFIKHYASIAKILTDLLKKDSLAGQRLARNHLMISNMLLLLHQCWLYRIFVNHSF